MKNCEPHGQTNRASRAFWDGPIEFVFADSMWLSRNITQISLKNIAIHVLILRWHYGGTEKKFFSQGMWKAAYVKPVDMNDDVEKLCQLSKSYAKKHVGVDMNTLVCGETSMKPPKLEVGELGFMGAFLDAGDVSLVPKPGSIRVSNMEIGLHHGEFRFDGESGEVDQYVVVVTSDTITKIPDTQFILLGLSTQDGISKRVGLGWAYCSKDPKAELPPWKYQFFRIA